jgi:hypothetical protein
MIDSVRSTVLSIISKDNRGYITPFEFNLFAKQAQLEIFEGMFYTYSNSVNKQNAHMHNSGYTDIPKQIEEAIDAFSDYYILNYNAITGKYNVSDDIYMLNTVIYNGTVEVEKVPYNKIYNLLSSNLTAPTVSYPVYTQEGISPAVLNSTITVYPDSIAQTGLITAQAVRFPKDPKWTYNTIISGTPIFDPTQLDYQDFELPLSYETDLVIKILQYAGLSIRETEITSAAKAEEGQNAQKV